MIQWAFPHQMDGSILVLGQVRRCMAGDDGSAWFAYAEA